MQFFLADGKAQSHRLERVRYAGSEMTFLYKCKKETQVWGLEEKATYLSLQRGKCIREVVKNFGEEGKKSDDFITLR